jgi:hypothetical protein
VCGEGNLRTKDKHAAFWAIKPPHIFADLQMLIGMFGFYSRWLPTYEIRIGQRRWIIKQQPAPGSSTPALERELVAELWDLPNLALLEPSRPDYNRQFYFKPNWSKDCMAGRVLCQANPDCPESVAAEKAEDAGGPYLFDKSQNRTAPDPHPLHGPSMYSPRSQLPLLQRWSCNRALGNQQEPQVKSIHMDLRLQWIAPVLGK